MEDQEAAVMDILSILKNGYDEYTKYQESINVDHITGIIGSENEAIEQILDRYNSNPDVVDDFDKLAKLIVSIEDQ